MTSPILHHPLYPESEVRSPTESERGDSVGIKDVTLDNDIVRNIKEKRENGHMLKLNPARDLSWQLYDAAWVSNKDLQLVLVADVFLFFPLFCLKWILPSRRSNLRQGYLVSRPLSGRRDKRVHTNYLSGDARQLCAARNPAHGSQSRLFFYGRWLCKLLFLWNTWTPGRRNGDCSRPTLEDAVYQEGTNTLTYIYGAAWIMTQMCRLAVRQVEVMHVHLVIWWSYFGVR